MTHVTATSHLLRDAPKIPVGALDLPSIRGLGLVSSQIIINTASTAARTRIFPTAQTRKPIPFVPSVWAHTCTTSSLAMPPGHGTVITQHWPKDPEATFAYGETTLPSAWSGKEPKAASVPSTTPSMFAQVVALPLTELRVVLKRRQLKALTPYHPDVWEYAL